MTLTISRIYLLFVLLLMVKFSFGQLFWVEASDEGQLFSYDFSTEIVTLIHDDLSAPFDLEILIDDQKVVWNDTLEAAIYWSNLDGTELEVLLQVDDFTPYYFDVDEVENRIYCTGLNSGYVFGADFFSSSLDTILEVPNSTYSSIAINQSTGWIAAARSDQFVDVLSQEDGVLETVDLSALSEPFLEAGESFIGEIRAADNGVEGYYFLLNGALHQMLNGNQVEPISMNSTPYEFFAYSSVADHVYGGSDDYEDIQLHEEILVGTPEFEQLNGQAFIEGHSALGMAIGPENPTLVATLNRYFGLKAYPIPVVSTLTIEHTELIARIDVYEVTGVLVDRVRNINSASCHLDLSHLSDGVYMLAVLVEGSIQTIRIVK